MNEVITVDEITEAVSKAAELGPKEFEVRALRPAYGGSQNATLIMRKSDSDKLLSRGPIKINWTSCRLIERTRDSHCFRCWELSHVKAIYNRHDRQNLCLKCDKEEHKAAECPNKTYINGNGCRNSVSVRTQQEANRRQK